MKWVHRPVVRVIFIELLFVINYLKKCSKMTAYTIKRRIVRHCCSAFMIIYYFYWSECDVSMFTILQPPKCHTIAELLIIVHWLPSRPSNSYRSRIECWIENGISSFPTIDKCGAQPNCVLLPSTQPLDQFECINQLIYIRFYAIRRCHPYSISRSNFALPSQHRAHVVCTRIFPLASNPSDWSVSCRCLRSDLFWQFDNAWGIDGGGSGKHLI